MKDSCRTHSELIEEISQLRQKLEEIEQTRPPFMELKEMFSESEAKYRTIMESTLFAVYIVESGLFRFVNKRWCEIYGYRYDEVIDKMSPLDLVYPEDREIVEENVRKRVSGEVKSSEYEFRAFRKDGRIINLRVFGSIMPYKGRNAMLGTALDLTNLRKAEEELRISQTQLSEAMDLAKIVYWEVDLAKDVFVLSDSFYSLCRTTAGQEGGYRITKEEYVKRFVHPDDRSRVSQHIAQNTITVDTESLPQIEHRLICRDGKVLDVVVRTRILRDASGRIIKRYGANQDITERKLAEKALVESEEKYRNVIENSLIGFYVIKDGLFRYVNRQFCEILGYSYQEIVDKAGPLDFVHPNDREVMTENIRKRSSGEAERIEYEFRVIRKDGQQVNIKVIASTMMHEGERVLTGTILDITKEKNLEIQLRQAQKIEAIGTLAGGIAHDFNNIITSLIGYAALMQKKMDKTGPMQQYIDQILLASRKAADLIQGLLTFSRQQTVSLVPLNINETIATAKKLLERLLTEDIELRTVFAKESIIVMADKSQIDQIFFNLITNARDAMPKGGVIDIETDIVSMNDEFIKFHGFGKAGNYAMISVSDTGVGMDRAMTEKIFDPFFTTKEVGKGTGLGLATVYGIVKQHNGFITVESVPNRGTTFRLFLPEALMEIKEEQSPAIPVTKGNETILIAEDNNEVRDFMRQALCEYGYTIVEALDGQDAIDKFKQNSSIDLVVLDSVMPKKNGREAYEEIHRIAPHVKVLFTSGYTKDIVLDKGIEDKEFNFIAKPLLLDELLGKIRQMLDDVEETK